MDPGKEFKIFRLKRVLLGVKSSPFLMATTIKHHLQRYVETFPECLEILNSSSYVDDFITSQPNVDYEFKISKEAYEIFQEACMTFRKWKTTSHELRKKWKEHGLHVDEITDNLNLTNQQLKS